MNSRERFLEFGHHVPLMDLQAADILVADQIIEILNPSFQFAHAVGNLRYFYDATFPKTSQYLKLQPIYTLKLKIVCYYVLEIYWKIYTVIEVILYYLSYCRPQL